ncbi:hypothetical protein AB0K04_21580 [Micromonospora coxensis]|uniref:hypothetical protein n=1 Tax=Micromonospora coxensis TaxID=356852 RepID=UPI003430EA8D
MPAADPPAPEPDWYDTQSSRSVPPDQLRDFLRDCFGVADAELFVGHCDRLDEEMRDVPPGTGFAVFCTYEETGGDFAMGFSVSVDRQFAARVDRLEFARRFAARFDAYVFHGHDEPEPWLWTVVLPDGTRLFATIADEELTRLERVSGPVPQLPGLVVDPRLGPPRYGRWSPDDE